MQENYIVLSRKYRPNKLSQLIGQEVLSQTLKNAFTSGKVAHAFILTGVRGIGKTTTARIIAKSLNCTDLQNNIDPCGNCQSCKDILKDSSLDVVEIDAASNTSVDDIRTIIDSVQYKPVNSKYKIFIIDEVHMLSNSAFNALLKTLEEPPSHVKFVFATTEIKKVPITVLSRCQRFDLPRVKSNELAKHLANICQKEQIEFEEKALALIAQSAQGSVRDGLSLLDQAIVLCNNNITSPKVTQMLGKGYILNYYQLIDSILKGQSQEALENITELYTKGSDPLTITERMLDVINRVLKIKTVASYANSPQASEEDLSIGKDIASKVSVPSLLKLWQVVLQGFEEIKTSSMPKSCLDVLIIKTSWIAQMPNIEDVIQSINNTKTKEQNTAESTKKIENSTVLSPTLKQDDATLQQEENNNIQSIIDSKIKSVFPDALKV